MPDEDQGWGIVAVQAPEGASLDYTKKIGEQVQAHPDEDPRDGHGVRGTGFSFAGTAPNRGLLFFGLKPYAAAPRQRALGRRP